MSIDIAQELRTQRQEYLQLHDSVKAAQAAMQESITALHNELLTCMKELLPQRLAMPTPDPSASTPLPIEMEADADL